MDKDADGEVTLSEFLEFYKVVIYDIPDDQFERGLGTFRDAVKYCADMMLEQDIHTDKWRR